MDELFSIQFCKGIRSYWRGRKYQKLKKAGKKTGGMIRLGSSSGHCSNRRFKMRSFCKLRMQAFNPVRILARIRDAYVNVMLGVAGKGWALPGSGGPELLFDRKAPKSRHARVKPKDYEKRLILEIYESVVGAGELMSKLKLC